ncbi:MAG: hypothetical protein LBU83_09925 [Bacteroidales bacterium]|jgi:ABC-type antimicrobial peptide transport system permease subunit|nr:hypothetical protein [Bacteroidales bacterium]
MEKNICLLFILILYGNTIYATPQFNDSLLYNDKEYQLLSWPLEGYFFENPDKRPDDVFSAQWRGYHADFTIKNNKLYVLGIYARGKNLISEIFDGLSEVYLNWITGLLMMPDGELLDPGHYGLGVIYEHYKFIEIENGTLIREYRINSEQYKKYENINYELYKKTEEYEEFIKKYESDIESEEPMEYKEIFNELNNGILPNELIEHLIKKYELNKIIELINQNNIENENILKPNKIVYMLIIGVIICLIGISLILLVNIRYRKKQNCV